MCIVALAELPVRCPSAVTLPVVFLSRGHLVDMEEETRRELAALQRERELLQAQEKDNVDAIDEVGAALEETASHAEKTAPKIPCGLLAIRSRQENGWYCRAFRR